MNYTLFPLDGVRASFDQRCLATCCRSKCDFFSRFFLNLVINDFWRITCIISIYYLICDEGGGIFDFLLTCIIFQTRICNAKYRGVYIYICPLISHETWKEHRFSTLLFWIFPPLSSAFILNFEFLFDSGCFPGFRVRRFRGPASFCSYVHFIGACHYLMPVLRPAVAPAPYVTQLAWEREMESYTARTVLINPYRRAEPTHCVLYSFPLSFSFRKRPNRAQKVTVKKRKRAPLCWGLSASDNGPAHFL